MKQKHDYDSIRHEDLCPGYCLWCETNYFAESPAKIKKSAFMVYPVYQWLIHKNHTEKASYEKQVEYFQFVEKHFMKKFVPEFEMLQNQFFQSHPYHQDLVFEVPDDPGRIYKNTRLRTYLDQFDENTQRHIYEVWCMIEKGLYRILYR